MDALSYVKKQVAAAGITNVRIKKAIRGPWAYYNIMSNDPYPQAKAEAVGRKWYTALYNSKKFEEVGKPNWGWAGKEDYYPVISVGVKLKPNQYGPNSSRHVEEQQQVPRKPSGLVKPYEGERTKMFNRQNGQKPTGRAARNPDYGSGEGPRPEDVGNHYRLTTQTYIAVQKVKNAIDNELTFIGQMDKADTAKEFVKLIAACRALHTQIDDALQVSRSSGQFRRRPGFSAIIDVFVKSGVLLQVAINDLQIAGSIAGSAKYTPERKLAVQKKSLQHASKSIESMRDNIHSQMIKFGNYDPEQWAPRNM